MATAEEMRRALEDLEQRASDMEEALAVKEMEEEAEAKAAMEAEDDAEGSPFVIEELFEDLGDSIDDRVTVHVLVNGQDVGIVEGNRVLGAVIQEFGARHGLRTVVAFSGDARLTADQATRTLQDLGVSTLDVRTKDQRA